MQEQIKTQADAWMEQGFVRGRTEKARRVLTRLLTLKFGPLAADVLARIEAADEDTLERWTERVLVAARIEAIFEPA